MKYLCCLSILITSFNLSAQNIGIRVNNALSDNNTVMNSWGGGAYLNINNFSKRFELLFSFDFFRKQKDKLLDEARNEMIVTRHYRRAFGVCGLYVIPVHTKIMFKIGLGFNYSNVEALEQGWQKTWMEDYKAHFTGFEFISNLHFNKAFNLPVNIDIFVSPNYLINVKNIGSYEYERSLREIVFQLGVSYIIEEKRTAPNKRSNKSGS